MIAFAHISDLHVDGSKTRSDRVRRIMRQVNDIPAPLNAIVFTGDIADHGTAAEYREARELLETDLPVIACPGNHDNRTAYRSVFLADEAEHDPATPVNRVHRLPGAAFAMCDSTVPGRDHGKLDDDTITWLEQSLDEDPGTPTFVCLHHPPVALHSRFVDSIRLVGDDRLADVLGRHQHVTAVLCGHAHTPAAASFAGLPLLVAPGVVSTLLLPWERGDIADYGTPPGMAFHVLDEDRRLVTHFRVAH